MLKWTLIILGLATLGLGWLIYKLVNPVSLPKRPLPSSESHSDSLQIPAQKARLYQDVKFLTEIQPARHSQNLASLAKAVHYIRQEFENLTTRVEIQNYQTPDGNTYQNIIASMGPDTPARVVIGAHYDVCGNQAGADDNASAVAGLLEIARLVRELQPQLKHRIDFVAFSLEEPPYFRTEFMGSVVHAQSLKRQNIEVKAMICLEMIGYFSEQANSQQYPVSALKAIYPSKGDFIAVVGKNGQDSLVKQVKTRMLEGANIQVYSINAPAWLTGIDFSDHRSYWAAGYPAIMITDTSFFRNPHYHQTSDTIETLDFDRMTEVVKGAYWALIHLK
ncbi:MAG: M28 family peptidase [Microscillaceae bacterium]|jgi:Zn-dependent M28 family amino/carboxypeptidase|nr:M28 family peptidase [Microscillaceae bacterium]